MARKWTIILVPPDNGVAKTIEITERRRRQLIAVGGAVGLMVAAAVVVLFTPYGTPSALALKGENERLTLELSRIDDRLKSLSDTLTQIAQRDQQIRLLAGLPADTAGNGAIALATTSSPTAENGKQLSSAGTRLPKPFLGRLGFSSRPDIEGMIARASQLSTSFRAVKDTITRNYERLANTPSILPTTGWLTSHYTQSRFHPVLHESRPHEGIDVSAPMGAPIIAPASGIIRAAGNEPGYGNTFEIDHGNGIVTRFAHCSKVLVRNGQRVTRGEAIATVGNTGLSTGPHLHYEVHVNGKPVDPLKFVLPEKVAD
jgi:murein DD-endopeptidase MepM/ murein hydrolase activator NlpD